MITVVTITSQLLRNITVQKDAEVDQKQQVFSNSKENVFSFQKLFLHEVLVKSSIISVTAPVAQLDRATDF